MQYFHHYTLLLLYILSIVWDVYFFSVALHCGTTGQQKFLQFWALILPYFASFVKIIVLMIFDNKYADKFAAN